MAASSPSKIGAGPCASGDRRRHLDHAGLGSQAAAQDYQPPVDLMGWSRRRHPPASVWRDELDGAGSGIVGDRQRPLAAAADLEVVAPACDVVRILTPSTVVPSPCTVVLTSAVRP